MNNGFAAERRSNACHALRPAANSSSLQRRTAMRGQYGCDVRAMTMQPTTADHTFEPTPPTASTTPASPVRQHPDRSAQKRRDDQIVPHRNTTQPVRMVIVVGFSLTITPADDNPCDLILFEPCSYDTTMTFVRSPRQRPYLYRSNGAPRRNASASRQHNRRRFPLAIPTSTQTAPNPIPPKSATRLE